MAYSARRTSVDNIEVVQLTDSQHDLTLSLAPSIGNMAYEIRSHGKNLLYFPYDSPAGLRAEPKLCGVPFLAPWANRLEDDSFWVNGKRYFLNPSLGNLRRDANQKSIHGILNFSPAWELVAVEADERSTVARSRLQFWKHPEMMAQFPFAHEISMTHRIADGVVEVTTAIDNFAIEPLPVAVGFHPYLQLTDAPRDEWTAHLAARDHLLLNPLFMPTGERKPIEFPDPVRLAGVSLDDVFGNLVRGDDGRATFWVQGRSQRITVTYGPKFTVAVVYAPPGKDFICFEPMSAVTNAFHLDHAGIYRELQHVPPGGQWSESFWIAPSGFW